MTYTTCSLTYGAQDEARESKMVFIGQNLDGEFLAGMFNKCLATPENLRRKASALRFALGATVACRTVGGAWAAGTVKGQLVRDAETPQDRQIDRCMDGSYA